MKIFSFFKNEETGNPPYDYYFLQNLRKHEYPKYLAKLFYLNVGEKLPLVHGVIDKRRCKTFNQKLQWVKLYGVTPLMCDCTDKVKVRDYVKEKIGEEYLKPVLQVIPNNTSVIARNDSILGDEAIQEEVKQETRNENSGIKPKFQAVDCHGTQNVVVPRNDGKFGDVSTYFNKIDFDKLPDSFVIKTNHGCKWQYIIKDKEEYLKNKRLFEYTKRKITGWLEQDYSFFNGFELNYQGIEPKIIIEPLLREEIDIPDETIQVYCFNSIPELIIRFEKGTENNTNLYDKEMNVTDDVLSYGDKNIHKLSDDFIKQTFVYSKQLSKDFEFVRVDWMIYKNKLYFEELTFTPYSGFNKNLNQKYNKKFGKLMTLGEKNEFQ